jgi:hypothetical protein
VVFTYCILRGLVRFECIEKLQNVHAFTMYTDVSTSLRMGNLVHENELTVHGYFHWKHELRLFQRFPTGFSEVPYRGWFCLRSYEAPPVRWIEVVCISIAVWVTVHHVHFLWTCISRLHQGQGTCRCGLQTSVVFLNTCMLIIKLFSYDLKTILYTASTYKVLNKYI